MKDLYKYYLEIADNAFILSHKLSEYCSRAPFLEEDLANTNVALDLIGLSESLYNEIAEKNDDVISGDHLAFKRNECDYVNCLLTEQPNTDFAHIMVRQFFMDAYHYYLFMELAESKDSFLNAIGHKSLKEVTYHLKRSSEWMVRLGKGTETSSEKTQTAINNLWRYTDELFNAAIADNLEDGVAANTTSVKANWEQKINEVFYLANLKKPENTFQLKGGKAGIHSEHMGYLLADIQYLNSKYPDAKW